ncbi:MAG: ABC transporter substrate-binding protein [Pseudomonadota bacterium]
MSLRILHFPGAALRALLAGMALCAAAAGPAAAQGALEKVTLQLKWKHQFQFAGYYTALEKGYYRNAGFDVAIQEAGGSAGDSISAVLSGKADFGVASSELALRRGLGDPVVVLATIMQHSALALAVRGAQRKVQDLDGKTIMVGAHDQELLYYLEREGLSRSRVKRVPQSYDLKDLTEGRVDGFSVYTTDQVWFLRQAGFAHTVISPRAGSIDFYGDTLFTSEGRVRANRERVEAFRDASVRGWQYAMAHPEEIADLILTKYGQRLTREHLLFEAGEMRNLMQPELIEIGHSNPGRWRHIAGVYAEFGMLPPDYSLEGFVLDTGNPGQPEGAPWWLSGAIVLALLAAMYGTRRLWLRHVPAGAARGPAPGNAVQGTAPQALPVAAPSSLRDAVTGLHTSAFLHEALAHELLRARRDGTPLGVVLVELEQLDQLQEAEGQGAANALLASLAGLLQESADGIDLIARLGGPLFAWVQPGVDAQEAGRRAAALRAAFAQARAWSGLIEVSGTIRCTVRNYPADAGDAATLLAPP